MDTGCTSVTQVLPSCYYPRAEVEAGSSHSLSEHSSVLLLPRKQEAVRMVEAYDENRAVLFPGFSCFSMVNAVQSQDTPRSIGLEFFNG